MNWNFFVVCTLVIAGLLLVPSVQGVNLLTIDTFATGGSATSIIYSIPSYGVSGTWYSPYYVNSPPQFKFFATADALGGQRDLILGHVDPVPIGSTAIVNVVSRRASISFPLNWIGGAYFQWDGIDDAGTGTAFPGSTLNPGLTAPVDITFNGRANGLALSITSDQDTDYRVTLVNSAGVRNQYRFTLIKNEPSFTFVPLLYSSPLWNSPGFNFADVRGFEVQIQTGTNTQSNAPDTQFTPLFIFSYAISGNAGLRCNCLQSGLDSELSNAQIDLFTAANVFVRSTNTDVNGDYTFWALNPATYNVCFHDTTALLCSSTPRCVSVTIDSTLPANVYTVNFVKTITTTFTIPADITGDCAACKIPDGTSNCPPFASITGCSGGTTTVTNFSDVTSGNTCSTTIVRTWTSPDDGSTKTQRLTYTDTTAPVFTVPPQDSTQQCNAVSTSINAWVTANAFSSVSDNCSPTIVTNNWNGASVGNCNAATVTFSLRDSCGNTASPRTATYRIQDSTPPTITQVASNSQAECDLKQGTDQTALNSWVASRGGAQATDNCVGNTVTWTNNFTPLTSGCSVSRTVTFTANDGCSNSASTTATFTIRDSTAPVITVSAQAASAQCSGSTSATQAFTNWRNNHGGAVATDACVVSDSSLVWTDDFTGVVSGGCNNAFPVTFTVTDLCGFSSATTGTFTVLDNTGPTLTTPAASQTIECGSTSIDTAYNSWVASNGGAVATDACTAVVWSNNAGPAPTNGCNSVSTVTFRATDSCNNAAVQTTATFTVRDTTSPTFTNPPSNSGQECSGNINVGFNAWLSSNAGATATDTCSNPVTITNDFPANGTPAVGCNAVTTVRFTAVDACSRSSQPLSATYTVTDTTPPTINPGASDTFRECNTGTNGQDYQNFLNTRGGAVATDFCSTFTWTNNGPASLSFTCTVSQTVTFTARDACGNAASTTATFSIDDNTDPVIIQQASDRTTQCNGGSGTNTDLNNWLNSRGGATASDNCGQVTWTNDFTQLTVVSACTSVATVTFTANDGCGQTARTTATFTVTDNVGPSINPPAQSLTTQCDPETHDDVYATWVADHAGARATDNCVPSDQLLWTVNDPVPVGDSCSSQSVTFTVTDGCGSASVTTAVFTIIDTNKPVFITPPQSVSFECDGAGNVQQYEDWVESFGGAVADDVCATTLTYATNAPLTGPVGCGSQPQTITVTDECNNAAIASSVFTIVDTIAPSIITPASDISIQCNPATNTADVNAWLSSRGGAEASDTCYATSSLSWSNNYIGLSNAACNPSARVIFTVSDPCGNVATTTASVTIVDTLVPILSSAATPAVFECNTEQNPVQISNYVTTHGGAQATDSCSGITWSNNFVNAPAPCVGPLPVIFTASDACGNRISSTGSIEIIDSVAPAFVDFPPDITVGCDKSTEPDATGVPDWNDACTTEITPSFSDVSFQKPQEKFCPGDIIITRTWTLVDSCGNTNSKDQIIVEEITRPVGPCLPSECPPCELVECCTNPLEDIECNPVACTPVHCTGVPCSAVPCIPRSCGVPPTPTGRPEGPVPLPSVLPAPSCEPVYIYVFDDDGEDVPVEPVIVYTTRNDSASLGLSLISLVIILFVTIF